MIIETEQEAIDKITHWLDLGRNEQEIVAEVVAALLQSERGGREALAGFAADERDRTILLSGMLAEAREYVTDALEAMEHSDGRDLLNRIDGALA